MNILKNVALLLSFSVAFMLATSAEARMPVPEFPEPCMLAAEGEMAIDCEGGGGTGTTETNRFLDQKYVDQLKARCNGTELSQEECRQYRDYARGRCINDTEYYYAKENNFAPVCNQFDPSKLIAVCRCGCFELGTKISARLSGTSVTSQVNIEDLFDNEKQYDVLAMADTATMSDVQFDLEQVTDTTKGPEEKPLVIVNTASGIRIGLSEEHGVLLASGKMDVARNLSVGDKLVKEDGSIDVITAIEQGAQDQVVYNLLTDSDDEQGHLVIANGLVMGDLYWQNILMSEMAKFQVRQ
ncbi:MULTISPECIES: hypothetical protein [Pseudoalteromonas]|uniref:Hint domain-containing protein n=1 Tax=Pseudoalteromonas amylolytica TaxID=1859457 RepID=A0A1S1MLA1_9GAMM|nr:MULTISPECIES: hypothetical protein [Pseudoalteromonas]OHU86988.1 hypothetical protein BFC16_13050 [Pseudoalteromonas sp. JW3]OHU88303.1 hypothetical protein BET10_19710 [Pseudoalteromonas amylolytica]